jgi:hypothetical protein
MKRVRGVLFDAVLSCDGTEPAKPTEPEFILSSAIRVKDIAEFFR